MENTIQDKDNSDSDDESPWWETSSEHTGSTKESEQTQTQSAISKSMSTPQVGKVGRTNVNCLADMDKVIEEALEGVIQPFCKSATDTFAECNQVE